jgi:hypothetical protein
MKQLASNTWVTAGGISAALLKETAAIESPIMTTRIGIDVRDFKHMQKVYHIGLFEGTLEKSTHSTVSDERTRRNHRDFEAPGMAFTTR